MRRIRLRGLRVKSTAKTDSLGKEICPTSPSTPTINNPSSSTETGLSGKLQRVLADLKVSTLPIPEEIKQQLIRVVSANLAAFAGSPTDLGRTSVVVHTIKTVEAVPFRHKLRPIPFSS